MSGEFYVKGTVGGVEVRIPFTGTAYTTCANCGAEMDVDIIGVAHANGAQFGDIEAPELWEGDWNCDSCSRAQLQAIRGEGSSCAILPFRAKNSDNGAGV